MRTFSPPPPPPPRQGLKALDCDNKLELEHGQNTGDENIYPVHDIDVVNVPGAVVEFS